MAIPAVTVTFVAIHYLLDYALPQWRPRWMRPFVVEHHISQVSELRPNEKRPSLRWVITLLVLAALGCAAEVSLLLSTPISFTTVVQPFSWVSMLLARISNATANHGHPSSWLRWFSLLSSVQGRVLFHCFYISWQLLLLNSCSLSRLAAPPSMHSKWVLIMLP